jgi:hypothetical protein
MKAGALLMAAACACSCALPANATAGTLPLAQSPAAGTYADAEPANTVGFSCASLAVGAATLVPDTLIALGVQGTPRVGEVFYIRLTATVLDDPCSGGTTVLPEFLPPKGVTTAIDAAHPVLLRYDQFDGDNVDDASVKVKPGESGGTEFDAISTRAPDGEPFPIAQGSGKMELYVPLRATRRTTAADVLNVVNHIGNGSTPSPLAASTGLPSAAPAKPVVKVGKKAALTIATVPGAKVTATLTVGKKKVGSAKGTVDAAGVATLKPKVAKGVKRAKLTLKTTLSDGSKAPDVTRSVVTR